LQAGTYRIEIEAKGFKTLVQNEVIVAPGSAVRVDGSLTIGEVSDTVEVSAQAPLLQTDSAKINTAVSQKFVNDLPLVVGGQLRSPLDLALITPEAKISTRPPGETFNLQFGGGQEGGWDATLDGLSSAPAAPFEQRLWTMINTPSLRLSISSASTQTASKRNLDEPVAVRSALSPSPERTNCTAMSTSFCGTMPSTLTPFSTMLLTGAGQFSSSTISVSV
jgi:hypothetical protein